MFLAYPDIPSTDQKDPLVVYFSNSWFSKTFFPSLRNSYRTVYIQQMIHFYQYIWSSNEVLNLKGPFRPIITNFNNNNSKNAYIPTLIILCPQNKPNSIQHIIDPLSVNDPLESQAQDFFKLIFSWFFLIVRVKQDPGRTEIALN